MKTAITMALVTVLCVSCATVEPHLSHKMTYELRIPTLESPGKARIDFFDGGAACGSGLTHCKKRTEGPYTVYSNDELVLTGVDYRFLFVESDESGPVQYFRVPIPSKPIIQNWSKWTSPSFVAYNDGNAYGPLFASGKKRRVKSIPPVHFEMRFMVEEYREQK